MTNMAQTRVSNISEFVTAIGNDDVCRVQELLVKTPSLARAKLNDRDDTALHMAAHLGHPKIIQVLLATGRAQIEAWNEIGETPLLAAAWHRPSCFLLINAGARKDACDAWGLSYIERVHVAHHLLLHKPYYCNERALNRGHEAVITALDYIAKLHQSDKNTLPDHVAGHGYTFPFYMFPWGPCERIMRHVGAMRPNNAAATPHAELAKVEL